MNQASSKMLWVYSFLTKLGFPFLGPMRMFCNNQVAIFIAKNPTFHERTKHIEIDCHDIWQWIISNLISTSYVGSSNQLTYIFTKRLSDTSYAIFSLKQRLFDLYALAWITILNYYFFKWYSGNLELLFFSLSLSLLSYINNLQNFCFNEFLFWVF